MRFIPSILASVIATCSLAAAQSFNLDIESQLTYQGQPSASYGAYPGQAGFWNRLPFTSWDLSATMLNDLSGAPTSAFAWSNEGGNADLPTACAGWGSEEIALYDGISGGQPLTLRISGLVPDVYTVYVYAKSDDNRETRVRIMPAVIVLPLTNIIMAVCPTATAQHSDPETFTYNTAVISAGEVLRIEVSRAMFDGGWKLSAVQIIQGATSVGTTYCTSLPSSVGPAAVMSAIATPSGPGEASFAANDLVLSASPVPAGSPALFFYGSTQVNAPFGNGIRCVGGTISRLPLTMTTPGQEMITPVDYAQTSITAGSTWNFQGLFRDIPAGGAKYNLTSAMQIRFGL